MIDYTKHPEYDNHELVKNFYDSETGLRGILAIHSTKLGPAVGGTRYFMYKSEEEALEDVLRLSRGMTYKCIMADVEYGGGKCALIAPSTDNTKSDKYIEAYGNFLKEFSTKFFTGEDVGMSQDDIERLAKITSNIIGSLAKAGDPSPFAALSTYYSIRGALTFKYNDPSLKNRVIYIKGLGKVGMELARLAYNEGAVLIVSDINENRVSQAIKSFPNISVISSELPYLEKIDIFSPCALGKDITEEVSNKIMADIICGSANNQLNSPKEGITLFNRGIIYVPDYISNGGGLINVVAELNKGGYNETEVLNKCKNIEKKVINILNESKESNTAPSQVADLIAKRVLNN
jgi:leucine dehydrogenase